MNRGGPLSIPRIDRAIVPAYAKTSAFTNQNTLPIPKNTMNPKSLLCLLVAAAVAIPALAGDFPKGSPHFVATKAEALAAAKENGKPVVMVFSAAWCPPCQAMKNGVYPSKEVTEFHDKFNWAYIDVDVETNAKDAQAYGVEGIPHIQFTDATGKSIDKQVGSASPSAFSKTLSKVLKKAGS